MKSPSYLKISKRDDGSEDSRDHLQKDENLFTVKRDGKMSPADMKEAPSKRDSWLGVPFFPNFAHPGISGSESINPGIPGISQDLVQV